MQLRMLRKCMLQVRILRDAPQTYALILLHIFRFLSAEFRRKFRTLVGFVLAFARAVPSLRCISRLSTRFISVGIFRPVRSASLSEGLRRLSRLKSEDCALALPVVRQFSAN